MPLDFVERCEQRPSFQRVAIANIRGEPQNSVAAALSRFKCEDRFNRLGARARHMARRGASGIYSESGGSYTASMRLKPSQNGLCAVDRLDAPSEREQIAPIAIGVKQGLERNIVWPSERRFELRKPILWQLLRRFLF